MKKRIASSISTDKCNEAVRAKTEGNIAGVNTSEDLEYDPKKDKELLSLGVRADGGPQISAKPTKVFKSSTEMDLGKYMSYGYNVNTGNITAKLNK